MKVVTPSRGAHALRAARCHATTGKPQVDVVLCVTGQSRVARALHDTLSRSHSLSRSLPLYFARSSGFLAFGSHCGFLQAVIDEDLEIAGVMGTSSGALVGSLFAAGLSPLDILAEFASTKPIERIRLNKNPWRGIFNLSPAIERLTALVPADFETLNIPLAVGVVSANDMRYAVVSSGSLPEAVVASAAVPVLFCPVVIPGRGEHVDGGLKSRVGLEAWRGLDRLHHPTAVHVVGRSSPFSGSSAVSGTKIESDENDENDGRREGELSDVVVVHSTRSKSSFWNLDEARLREHFDASYEAARLELAASHDKLTR